MSFWKRVKDITKANLNSLLTKAEDPEKMIDQYVLDMEEEIQQMRSVVAEAISQEKIYQKKYQNHQSEVDKWQKKAELAIEAGNDDLARKALQRKNESLQDANYYQEKFENQKTKVEEYRQRLDDYENKLESAKRKREDLKLRAKSAKAEKEINERMAGIGETSVMDDFGRMEEKILQMETQAEASSEMVPGKSLDDEFAELEAKSSVDDELAALKKKMNKE